DPRLPTGQWQTGGASAQEDPADLEAEAAVVGEPAAHREAAARTLLVGHVAAAEQDPRPRLAKDAPATGERRVVTGGGESKWTCRGQERETAIADRPEEILPTNVKSRLMVTLFRIGATPDRGSSLGLSSLRKNVARTSRSRRSLRGDRGG